MERKPTYKDREQLHHNRVISPPCLSSLLIAQTRQPNTASMHHPASPGRYTPPTAHVLTLTTTAWTTTTTSEVLRGMDKIKKICFLFCLFSFC